MPNSRQLLQRPAAFALLTERGQRRSSLVLRPLDDNDGIGLQVSCKRRLPGTGKDRIDFRRIDGGLIDRP